MAKSKEQPPRNGDNRKEELSDAARADGRQYPEKKERRTAREMKRSAGAPIEVPVAEKEGVAAASKEETPAVEPALPETGPFDTTAFVKGVENSYLKLAAHVSRYGIDPLDFPDEVW